MNSQDDLFQLIKQMNPSEKGYFRRRSRRLDKGKRASYLELFDAIEAQKDYDEAQLRESLKEHRLVKQLPVAKHDLFEKLLRTLREYHLLNDPRLEIRARLDNIYLLHKRGLYQACRRLLLKTKKHANHSENFRALSELIRMELRLVKSLGGKGLEKRISELMAEEREILERFTEKTLLLQAHDEMFGIISTSVQMRSDENKQKAFEIISRNILAPDHLPIGFEARIFYHYIHSYYARLKGDTNGLEFHLHAIVQLWTATPRQRKLHQRRYRIALFGFLDSCLETDNFDGFKEWREVLGQIKPNSKAESFELFCQTFHLDLRFNLILENGHQLGELESKLHNAQEAFGPMLEWAFLLPYYFNISLLCFLTDQYQKGLSWTMRILEEHQQGIRQDILLAARLFQCLYYFELGKFDLLENTLSTSNRFFQRKGSWLDLEKLVIKYLVILLKEPDQTDVWKRFRIEMESLEAKTGGTLPGQTEILIWIGRKVK